jgi:hypothetical protein
MLHGNLLGRDSKNIEEVSVANMDKIGYSSLNPFLSAIWFLYVLNELGLITSYIDIRNTLWKRRNEVV